MDLLSCLSPQFLILSYCIYYYVSPIDMYTEKEEHDEVDYDAISHRLKDDVVSCHL